MFWWIPCLGREVISDQRGYESSGFSIKLDIAAINQWLMCLQQDESQSSYVALLSGSENRCFNISCEGLYRYVFLPRVLGLQVL